jgi:hypothetical protein
MSKNTVIMLNWMVSQFSEPWDIGFLHTRETSGFTATIVKNYVYVILGRDAI